tara:strand:+ start:231 stop:884 length:654 start_codon:yes stop_codon:yes gene_type:complete
MKLIQNKLGQLKTNISSSVTIVAVSKTKPLDLILDLYNHGQLHFGENKVQELLLKEEKLPKEIKWHMIGHLQRNKVRPILPFIHLIHSVDSMRLVNKINQEAKIINRKINILLQVKISKETSKYGFDFNEIEEILNSNVLEELDFVKVVGLMGMATFSNNISVIETEFNSLNHIYNKFKTKHAFKVLSMGMSADYEIAVKNGSNMLRLGSIIFGSRN